jgi:hypothetical protein
MNAHAFTIALQRLRSEVGQTVADDADVNAELRHLISALGGSAPAG